MAHSPSPPKSTDITLDVSNASDTDKLQGTEITVSVPGAFPQNADDPFDYERKNPNNNEFTEMVSMVKLWNVFLDECGKFDVEMVEDWRDALDVLVVFAGLLSAITTTFVSHTYRVLQPNYHELHSSRMDEVSELIRASAVKGSDSIFSVARSPDTPDSFVPNRSAIWVHGLWFASLALSLTTALIAAVAKQWIHQYTSITSATLHEHNHIQQFRYMGLQSWHVPVIIELLPILLHISLAVFFAGLTTFICSLNTTMALIVGGITFIAFSFYIVTNLLPLLKPNCPYKTPLTLHSHSFSRYLWRCLEPVRHWFTPPIEPPYPLTYEEYILKKYGAPSSEPLPLKALERSQIHSDASNIDIQCLSWLFDESSNSSVQRAVMQAVSNLPLRDSDAVRNSIPSLKDVMASTMVSIQQRVAERPVYERLFRALSRIEDGFALPRCFSAPEPGDRRLSTLANSHKYSLEAAEFLRAQLVNPTVNMDVLSWALIMASALYEGSGWLDVEVEGSAIWNAIIPMLLEAHCDKTTNYGLSRKELVTFTFVYPQRGLEDCPLTILDAEGTETAMPLGLAIRNFMFPSFTKIILHEYDPSLRRFPADLPSNIAVQLNLMISPSIRAQETWRNTLWQHIEAIVGLRHPTYEDPVTQYPDIILPLFDALLDVLFEDDFLDTDTLTLGQKMDTCLFLFRAFSLDINLQQHMRHLLTPTIIEDILEIAFTPSTRLPSPLITDILNFLVSSVPHMSADVYEMLREREWLEEIEDLLSSREIVPHPAIPRESTYDLSYPFLAHAYVHGLDVLKYVAPLEYQETLRYLTPPKMLQISKLILLADADRRKILEVLASAVGETTWAECGKALSTFLESEAGKVAYEHRANGCAGHDPVNYRTLLRYGTYQDLKELVIEVNMRSSEAGKETCAPVNATSKAHHPPPLNDSNTVIMESKRL